MWWLDWSGGASPPKTPRCVISWARIWRGARLRLALGARSGPATPSGVFVKFGSVSNFDTFFMELVLDELIAIIEVLCRMLRGSNCEFESCMHTA